MYLEKLVPGEYKPWSNNSRSSWNGLTVPRDLLSVLYVFPHLLFTTACVVGTNSFPLYWNPAFS